MQNVFFRIDHVWSYNFIGSIKGFIDLSIDVVNHLYSLATEYVKLQHNFIYNHNAKEFNKGYQYILMELQRYPIDTSFFEGNFKELYNFHRLAFNSLKGEIETIKTYCNDEGNIEAFIIELRECPPCIQSILNPISQLGINQLY
ncbi:hypothetical protein [Pseudomonas phage PA1C]|uniref:Uncharacterized protein n=2 Tax=root TaxID=1 RepID=A0A5C1K6S2_9CAUD|nr:hypothetical protein PP933_gp109 [Pseudomonas phage vB_PaeM_PS119XW]QBX32264.1 hypothetical protein [Pseudomonas phage PA1C]QEM41838.1 hypothetical protein [Pseudomonas phage vB_PaeM_PS119XW]BEG72746.1 hypothetical protein RVBP21_3740 [Pseudomonas phage BRkr]